MVLGIDTRRVAMCIGFGSMWEKHTWVEAVCVRAPMQPSMAIELVGIGWS